MAHDETAEPAGTPARGAQTVAPVQASALRFAASILGEASYTPQAELKGTLSAPSRVSEPVVQPVVQPVAEPVVQPVAAPPAPAEPAPAEPAPAEPAPADPVADRAAEPVPAERGGWFGRLVAKLLGRG
ncbi:hypothetical protein [Kineococcus sp. SYSU DK018]|uniref:hypothetical protein n=1 Tax=Kineococcus sp. SYSU DK018 TaxID=3383139 RepID=UPI003D7DAE4B